MFVELMEKVVSSKFSNVASMVREDLATRGSKDNATKLMTRQRLEDLKEIKERSTMI